ncbi:MAG TPA: DUF2306 domain-containing protein [Flavobacteriales bacterium]|nr:DUF2306 domain-containing protein [Flavobacteriales bacterium]
MQHVLKYNAVLLYFLLAFFTYLMVRITLPYGEMKSDTAFLALKQSYIDNRVWMNAFYIHVFTSCFLLLAGFTQFSNKILKKRRTLHRNMGKMYVFVLLFASGPAGFIMSIYANGGLYSKIAFTMLSVLWLTFTALAWYYAVKRNFVKHKNFMILSFALTCSALTLRLWKMGIVYAFNPHPMDAYRIVAWLGWVPNLLLALWLIRPVSTKNKVPGTTMRNT